MTEMNVFKVAGVIDILIYLEKYPEGRRKVDIRTDVGLNSTTAIKAHKELRKAGFLQGLTYDNATAWALTSIGLEIAKALKKIKKTLEKRDKDPDFHAGGTWFIMMNSPFKIDKGKPKEDDD